MDEERELQIIEQHEKAKKDFQQEQQRIDQEIHNQNGENPKKQQTAPYLKMPPRLDPIDDIRNYDFPEGFGSAFVEFTSVYEARRARKNIHLGKYGQKTVECGYLDEGKFERSDFTREPLVQVEKPSGDFEGMEKFAIDFNNVPTFK